MPLLDKSDETTLRIDVDQVSIYGQDAINFKGMISDKIKAKPGYDIHLNFSQVKYIDSATIGTLLYFIQVLKKNKKKIIIDKITPELKDLLDTLMLEKYIQMPGR